MTMKFDPTAICGACDAVFPNSESDAHRCKPRFNIGDRVTNSDHPEYGVGVIDAVNGDEFRWHRLGKVVLAEDGVVLGGTGGPKGHWQKFEPELN